MADMRSLATKRVGASMTPETWAATLLGRLGIHQTPGAVQALVGWAKAEGGHWNNSARYNPLNTTQVMPGYKTFKSVGQGSANIGIYNSWQQGLDATVKTLRGDSRYAPILRALQAGNPNAVADAIGASPWGTTAAGARAAIGATPRVAGVRAVGGALGAAPGASASTPALQTTTAPAFDQTAFETARKRFALGQLLAGQGQAKDNPLFAAGLVTTTPPSPQDFTTMKTTTTQVVQPSASTSTPTAAPSGKGGVQNFEGMTVASWIAPALQYARQHGWKGAVRSGYRSFADQKKIYDSGVRPAAVPGTSNHEGSQFPRGAVDVSEAAQLASILRRSKYGRLLQWAGAKDPVHFSHPHNGSY